MKTKLMAVGVFVLVAIAAAAFIFYMEESKPIEPPPRHVMSVLELRTFFDRARSIFRMQRDCPKIFETRGGLPTQTEFDGLNRTQEHASIQF